MPKYGEHLDISYRNMAFLDNTATNTGSALYFYRYENTPVAFKHLTVANNTGGDGAMIYQMMGNAYFTNDPVQRDDRYQDVQPDVRTGSVLRYVSTSTATASSWGLTDLSPITATLPLLPMAITSRRHPQRSMRRRCRGNPRYRRAAAPMGTAPDLGRRKPYSLSLTGVQASKVAGEPSGRSTTQSECAAVDLPGTAIAIPFAYNAAGTAPAVTAYTLEDFFPTVLDLVGVSTPSGLSHVRGPHTPLDRARSPSRAG